MAKGGVVKVQKSARDAYSSGGGRARGPVTGNRYDGFFPGNLANASAASTTAGAPAQTSVGAPQNSPQQPQTPPDMPPQAHPDGAPPVGVSNNPPVAPHADMVSLGTHDSTSPAKKANPVHPQ